MDAEQQAPPSEDTPANTPTPEVEGGQPEVNWEERYKHLQSDHTRAAQEAAEYRRIVEAARQGDPNAIAELGLALAEEAEDDDDEPLDPRVAAKLQALEERFEAQQQQEQEHARIAEIETAVERELDSLKVSDEELRDWLVSRAIALAPTADGLPDIQAAYQQFEALMTAQKKQWATTKRTHHVSAVGQEGTQVPDLTTHEGRVANAMSKLHADQ